MTLDTFVNFEERNIDIKNVMSKTAQLLRVQRTFSMEREEYVPTYTNLQNVQQWVDNLLDMENFNKKKHVLYSIYFKKINNSSISE